jgi:PAS domain S-box-containing protein
MNFWRFYSIDLKEFYEIQGHFDYSIIVLSIFVAVMAAYAMQVVLERIWVSTQKKMITFWIWLCAIVMGFGVWSMHFCGMLAFKLPVEMSFSTSTTIFSVLPSIIGFFFAIKILAQRQFTFWRLQLGALSMAIGIGSMHFIGMEAMLMPVEMVYDFWLFIGAILVAHILATIALYVRVIIKTSEKTSIWIRILSASLMGTAISGMHYTAMSSVSFYAPIAMPINMGMHGHESVFFVLAILILVSIFVAIALIGTIVDRRLQHAEKTTIEQEVREKVIVESLADALIVIDENGEIETFNHAGQHMFSYDSKDVIGKCLSLLIPDISYQSLLDDAENQKVEKSNNFSYSQNDNVNSITGRTIETTGIKSTGERFSLEVIFSTMVISGEIQFSALARDISKRKIMEQQLRQSQKLESIGQLAAGIAHEINTPTQYVSDNINFLKKAVGHVLQALEMYRSIAESSASKEHQEQLRNLEEMLQKAKFDFIKEEIPKAIDQSHEGLKRVTKIVSAMKSFSHPSEGKKCFINVVESIETTVTICRNEWKYIADIQYEYTDPVPQVAVLPDEFNQVILNLIVNSAHAINDTLNSEKKMGVILISIDSDESYLIIKIKDDGAGIPKNIQDKVFEPFFTTKKVGEGTGQGLSMVYSVIVDKHNGLLELDSEEGEGTCFILKLPLTNPDGDEENQLPIKQ